MKVNLLSQISMTIIVDISSLVSTSLGRKQNYLCISSAICYDDATKHTKEDLHADMQLWCKV